MRIDWGPLLEFRVHRSAIKLRVSHEGEREKERECVYSAVKKHRLVKNRVSLNVCQASCVKAKGGGESQVVWPKISAGKEKGRKVCRVISRCGLIFRNYAPAGNARVSEILIFHRRSFSPFRS